MLFDVEGDAGDIISCYLVTDSPAQTPVMRITSAGQELASLEANELRPSVLTAGRHLTGQCGFRITDSVVPNLGSYRVLELREAETDFSIYRRRPSESTIGRRLFCLELSQRRAFELDRHLDGLFQLSFGGVDRLGYETTFQTLLLKSSESVYVSARLLFRDFEFSGLDRFLKFCVLQDPAVELAETLIALQSTAELAGDDLDLRRSLTFQSLKDHFQNYDLTNTSELHRAFARLPGPIEGHLANQCRGLASRSTDAAPGELYFYRASLAYLV